MATVQYGLQELPDGIVLRTEGNKNDHSVLKWSGAYPIPTIGDRVRINFNQFGEAEVTAYFIEHSYIGLETKLLNTPEWHRKQHPAGSKHHGRALVFGSEITALTYQGNALGKAGQ